MIARLTTFIVLLTISLLTVISVVTQDSAPTRISQAQGVCGSGTRCPDPTGTPGLTDPDVNSSLNVTYRTDEETPREIEPQTGTSWEVTAKYISTDDEGTDCECTDADEISGPFDFDVTFDVDWNGTAWVPGNQNGFTGPFNSVDICSTSSCNAGGGAYHSSGYKLHVNLDNPIVVDCPIDGPREFWLDQVLYTTTNVNNGQIILPPSGLMNPYCTLGAWRTPVTQVFQTGDNGQFECTDLCPFGPSLVIKYNPNY